MPPQYKKGDLVSASISDPGLQAMLESDEVAGRLIERASDGYWHVEPLNTHAITTLVISEDRMQLELRPIVERIRSPDGREHVVKIHSQESLSAKELSAIFEQLRWKIITDNVGGKG